MYEKPYKQYYNDLYVIQDAVFEIVEDYDFYLTGGTALSRFYLNHRYSDFEFSFHSSFSPCMTGGAQKGGARGQANFSSFYN